MFGCFDKTLRLVTDGWTDSHGTIANTMLTQHCTVKKVAMIECCNCSKVFQALNAYCKNNNNSDSRKKN